MEPAEPARSSESRVPSGHRQGLITAITVFLGFSLSFLRFWSLENPGEWTWKSVVAALIVAAGIAVQLVAMFRSLQLRDDAPLRYAGTVRWFFWGVVIVSLGVVVTIVVAP